MTAIDSRQDAVVIGGGFYGAAIAAYLAKQRGFKRITLIEREPALLTRASYHNQARVHNGYHYPRSFTTAYRSRVNYPKFLSDWPSAVQHNMTKLYAIARRNSKVTPKQFERFCREIGAAIQPADPSLCALFEEKLISAVFLVEESAFDARVLAKWAERELTECNVRLNYNACATSIGKNHNGALDVIVKLADNSEAVITSRFVFNCTYSGLNQFKGDFLPTKTPLKHEITEMALLQVPTILQELGITVMDGPFFSLMPFPARNLHTLSHVRYTPHLPWNDEFGVDPYQKLTRYVCETRVDRMMRDVGRYLPAIRAAKYMDSLFEIKTVLTKNESDDGRPILFEKHTELPGCYSILGGKIDNLYDALEKLDAESLPLK